MQSSYIVPDQTHDIGVMVGQILKIDSENACIFCVMSNCANLELAGDTKIHQILRARLGSGQLGATSDIPKLPRTESGSKDLEDFGVPS